MGFKAAGQPKPGGQLVRPAEKIDLLRQRPAIVARQQIDKARVETAGLGEAGLQARQMLFRRFMLGGEHPTPLKRMAIYSSPRRLQAVGELPPLLRRQRDAGFDTAAADALQFIQRLRPGGRHSPEGAKAFQLHGGFLRRTSRRAGRRASRTAGWPPAGRYYRSRRRGARPPPDRRRSGSGRGSRGRSPAPEWRSDRQLPASRFPEPR